VFLAKFWTKTNNKISSHENVLSNQKHSHKSHTHIHTHTHTHTHTC
jgi:hypothetical protein